MVITTAHAKHLGWANVEFDDGLGFRPCTAVCAWNPEFQYRTKIEVKKQIKWSDLPIGTRVVDAWGTELEYRGVLAGGALAFEHRDNTVTCVARFSSQLARIATEQRWLNRPIMPEGILWERNKAHDCFVRVVRIADGYELC